MAGLIKNPAQVFGLFCLSIAILLLASCTTTHTVKHESYSKPIQRGSTVVLMEPDIECSAITASGVAEPHAAWTAKAQKNVRAAIKELLAEHGTQMVDYDESTQPWERIARVREFSKLHGQVGSAMLTRAWVPTAKSKTDWTLGPGVQVIREDLNADYALFVFIRDQYETGGRTAARMGWAVLGVMTTPAVQYGFASLVDLRSGDIVWFNQMHSQTGEIREAGPAKDTVAELLTGCPAL